MKARTIKTWYRQAIVTACLAVVILLGAFAYFMLRESEGSAEAEGRLAGGGTVPLGVSGVSVSEAGGGLRLCNKTPSRVGVAIGYKESRQWTTEGWWNVGAGTCETLMAGPLVSRFYYVYAVDYDQGGVWGGKATMCTRDKMFTIKGIEDCVARGFERDRLLRGRHRRAEELDRPADRTRPARAPAADEAVAQGQDPRDPRSGLLRQGDHRAACSEAGADVFRINMSHTDHDTLRRAGRR